MANERLVARLVDALERVAADHGADIVDVEVVGASKAPCVRVRVDHADEPAGPITLDEVAAHTGWVNEVVEQIDPFPGAYTVEVSSPGLDRPLRRPRDFERFAGDYRATGQFLPALDALKEELADPVADNIIESLRVTREVGGTDLGRLLGTLSEFLRENSRTRSELEARQSWTVNAARLSVAAPWLILLLMASQPAAVSAYDSPAGAVVLLGGLAISAIAYRLMLRLGALPEPERVLR